MLFLLTIFLLLFTNKDYKVNETFVALPTSFLINFSHWLILICNFLQKYWPLFSSEKLNLTIITQRFTAIFPAFNAFFYTNLSDECNCALELLWGTKCMLLLEDPPLTTLSDVNDVNEWSFSEKAFVRYFFNWFVLNLFDSKHKRFVDK